MNRRTSEDPAERTNGADGAPSGGPTVDAPRARPDGGRPAAEREPGGAPGPTGPGAELERNPGAPLDLDWVRDARANRSAVERRAATLSSRRSVKRDWQAAWLLRAVTFLDLTTLSGADTPGRVRRLCAKARRPVRRDLLEAMGMADRELTVAAVCVYGSLVPVAVEALAGTDVPVASVAAGFPSGLGPFEERLDEVGRCREAGADEIDVVVTRGLVLRGAWQRLYDELRAFRDACGEAHLKVILGTGEIGTLRNVARASRVAMLAGADFVKTSTGKETVNATLPVGLVMARSVRAYHRRTGHRVGFKPAGGIRTAKDALRWLYLVKDELGDAWLDRRLFRFGASSLLADVERQLEHHVTGRYSAFHRHPMA